MEERNQRFSLQGVVVSDKMEKTITVQVETHKKHAKYGKRVKYRKKYYAHDENNEAKVGDTVTIMQVRPLSKTKSFRLVSIDKKAELSIKAAEAELKLEEASEVKAEEAVPTEKVEEAPVETTEVKEEVKEEKPAEASKAE